jgi:hypothetical protein
MIWPKVWTSHCIFGIVLPHIWLICQSFGISPHLLSPEFWLELLIFQVWRIVEVFILFLSLLGANAQLGTTSVGSPILS